ncbi:MAG: epoxide hydrolase [Ilumatobacter sp.]|uniref:epoxide hydrolase family protein n=1 Tax=Ilumatobacter sp. TaxID=1967498 RepID=UPI00260374D1|nr:epoxide hydrolase [Ilumatobacter sp.]MDJ0767604.1 epoxide hydrolase [Ilumatobacter sp.]
MSDIVPFTIDVPDAVLEDLRVRLTGTRWPDRELVDDWSQGVPLAYVREVCRYWADNYEWRRREAALNRFDQFTTPIDGLDLHVVHQLSPHPEALPLLVTHGWPGSIVEFHKVIEPLTDPTRFGGSAEDAFHVVAPSLPGFAFSGKPTETGWGVERIGAAFTQLMARLGYDRYVAQGGDWGSAITSVVGAVDPAHCAAIHLTLAMSTRPPGTPTEPDELHAMERIQHYMEWDSGYSTQQKSRPQTLGYGLADSPAGQAAWILEKFWSWTDCDGHPENALTRDEMLDNIMLYWVTESATSSARIYWESFGRAERAVVEVPTGFTVYPREIVPPVRSWVAELYPNVVYWNEQPKGGHFAALEVPDAFVADLRECFRPHR